MMHGQKNINISLSVFFLFIRSKVENQSSFMQKWGRINLRFTKRTANVTIRKEVTNEVEQRNGSLELSTSRTRVFRKLPSNNISTIGLKEYTDLVLGGKLGEVQADETCCGKNGGLQDSETDEKDTKKNRGDPVMLRDPEFEKQSYRPIASRLTVLENQTIQINGNFGTKFCGVLWAVHITYLALFPSQCRGQVLVNL